MRKYLQIIFVIVYTLLSFLLYQNFVEQDESNVHNLFGGIEKYERGSLVFNQYIDDKRAIQLIDRSIEISKDKDISINFYIYKREENGKQGSLEYYISASDEYIESYLPKEIEIPNNFSNSNYYFTTEKTDDPMAINIFTYYKGLSFTLKPMHRLKERNDYIVDEIDYFYRKDQENIDQYMQEKFSDFQASQMDIGSHQFDKDEAIKKLFIYYASIALILSLIYIFFKLSYKVKDISVYNLNGYSNTNILVKIFKSEILINLLSLIFVPLIAALLIFKSFNIRMIEFLAYNYLYLSLLFLTYILSCLVGVFFLRSQSLSDLLKNKNFNAPLTTITFVLAIIISITILSRIESPIINFKDIYNSSKLIRANKDFIRQYNGIQLRMAKDRSFEYDSSAIKGSTIDPVYEKHKKIYDNLNKNNNIIMQRRKYYVDKNLLEDENRDPSLAYKGYEVNENYMKQVKLYDNGSLLDMPDMEDNTVYAFMPRDLYENSKWSKELFKVHKDAKIKLVLYDWAQYSSQDLDKFIINYQPIFLLEKDGNALLNHAIDTGLFVKDSEMEHVKTYLEKESVEKNIDFSNGADKYLSYSNGLRNNGFRQAIEIIPAAFLLFMTLTSMKHFYIESSKKRWGVYKSLGYNSLYVVKGFIYESASIFILSLIYYIIIVKEVPIYTLLVLFLLILINIILIFLDYKKLKIVSVLR